jgi:hypothetical protein
MTATEAVQRHAPLFREKELKYSRPGLHSNISYSETSALMSFVCLINLQFCPSQSICLGESYRK